VPHTFLLLGHSGAAVLYVFFCNFFVIFSSYTLVD